MLIGLEPMAPHPDRTRQYAPEVYGNEIATYRTTYTQRSTGSPQIVLVEQPDPGSVLLPHYHASDQYQVFMDGGGMLGNHPLQPVSIHYTNRFTGYGPIVAGPQGLTYYVMRPAIDPLGPGQYLHNPELRERVKSYKGKRRTFTEQIETRGLSELSALRDTIQRTLFAVEEPEEDAGILAIEICLPPGAHHIAPEPATGGGQVLLVVQGDVTTITFKGGPRSALALTPEEKRVTIQAGGAGAQVLFMQYPRDQQRNPE